VLGFLYPLRQAGQYRIRQQEASWAGRREGEDLGAATDWFLERTKLRRHDLSPRLAQKAD
jgi:hypothetical protein